MEEPIFCGMSIPSLYGTVCAFLDYMRYYNPVESGFLDLIPTGCVSKLTFLTICPRQLQAIFLVTLLCDSPCYDQASSEMNKEKQTTRHKPEQYNR